MRHSNIMVMLSIIDRLERIVVRLSPYLVLAVLFLAVVGICTAQDMMRVVRGGWRREEATPAGPTNIPYFDNSVIWLRWNVFTNAQGKIPDSSAIGTNDFLLQAGSAPTYIGPSMGCFYDSGDYCEQIGKAIAINGATIVCHSVWFSNTVWSTLDGIFYANGTRDRGIQLGTVTSINHQVETINWDMPFDSPVTNWGWRHLFVQYNYATRLWTAYTNGVLTHSVIYNPFTNAMASGSDAPYRTGWDGVSGHGFWGCIDDVIVWTNANFTSNDVLQLYQFGH